MSVHLCRRRRRLLGLGIFLVGLFLRNRDANLNSAQIVWCVCSGVSHTIGEI
jgi:hypothetical protein